MAAVYEQKQKQKKGDSTYSQTKTLSEKLSSISYRNSVLLIGFSIFSTWFIATFFLEGFLLTLQRPDAIFNRMIYIIVANILIGVILTMFSIKYILNSSEMNKKDFGFRNTKYTIITVIIGVALGILMYMLQNPPSLNPIVIINAYAQVLAVTIAEILVCWVLLGNIAQKFTEEKGRYVSIGIAILISSITFGIYHYAHSPPFNTMQMVLFLTLIGLITSVFYFVVKNLYATVAFHNFLGITGVIGALKASGNLAVYYSLQIPLFIIAGAALAILISVDLFWIRNR
jgi:hypothetical protein